MNMIQKDIATLLNKTKPAVLKILDILEGEIYLKELLSQMIEEKE